jgi:Mg2+ and Co2+ transporter CorA
MMFPRRPKSTAISPNVTRERIRKRKGRICVSGVDYLAYALLDAVVDNYIYIVERVGERIEDLEDRVLTDPDPSVISEINVLKREMAFLRKSTRPAREAISMLSKLDSELVHDQTLPFLKDLLDHVAGASEAIDTYRDMLSHPHCDRDALQRFVEAKLSRATKHRTATLRESDESSRQTPNSSSRS